MEASSYQVHASTIAPKRFQRVKNQEETQNIKFGPGKSHNEKYDKKKVLPGNQAAPVSEQSIAPPNVTMIPSNIPKESNP